MTQNESGDGAERITAGIRAARETADSCFSAAEFLSGESREAGAIVNALEGIRWAIEALTDAAIIAGLGPHSLAMARSDAMLEDVDG